MNTEFSAILLLFAFGACIALFIELPWWGALILSVILWCSLVRFCIIELKKSWGISGLYRYFTLKSGLLPFLELFKKSVYKDAFTQGVEPIEITDIQKNMANITSVLRLIIGPLILFRKTGVHLPEEAKNILERFIAGENQWITEYIAEFRGVLMIWLDNHTAELSEYQRKNLLSKNKEIYSLSSVRLESHIQELERMRIRI